MFGSLINLFYPAICQACYKKTLLWNQHICDDCVKKIKNRVPPFCVKCGKQLEGGPDIIAACCDCKSHRPYFDRAWSACHYEGVLKELIHNFKYRKMMCLTGSLANIVVNFMKQHNIGKDADIILSIPMHPRRLFKREINTSYILAGHIAKMLKLRFSPDALAKIRHTPLQSSLKRCERIKNISDSFAIKHPMLIKGKNVLLVDDLFTTGSTVNECSQLLKASGSRNIEVITLARGYSTI